jgi:hypothetical protein
MMDTRLAANRTFPQRGGYDERFRYGEPEPTLLQNLTDTTPSAPLQNPSSNGGARPPVRRDEGGRRVEALLGDEVQRNLL